MYMCDLVDKLLLVLEAGLLLVPWQGPKTSTRRKGSGTGKVSPKIDEAREPGCVK